MQIKLSQNFQKISFSSDQQNSIQTNPALLKELAQSSEFEMPATTQVTSSPSLAQKALKAARHVPGLGGIIRDYEEVSFLKTVDSNMGYLLDGLDGNYQGEELVQQALSLEIARQNRYKDPVLNQTNLVDATVELARRQIAAGNNDAALRLTGGALSLLKTPGLEQAKLYEVTADAQRLKNPAFAHQLLRKATIQAANSLEVTFGNPVATDYLECLKQRVKDSGQSLQVKGSEQPAKVSAESLAQSLSSKTPDVQQLSFFDSGVNL